MKRFLKRIAYFFVPIVLLMFIGEHIVNSGLRDSNFGEYAEWNEILKGEINADVIINGSSRAQVIISPKVLDSVLDVNSYNLGFNGYLFNMEYYYYTFYRKKNKAKPKLIIQVLGYSTLFKRNDLYAGYQFYPYLNEEGIDTVLKQYTGYAVSDKTVPFLRYMRNPKWAILGVKEYFGIESSAKSKYKGFIANNKKWDGTYDSFIKRNPNGVRQKLNTNVIDLFKRYLKEVKNEKIKIIFVYVPEYAPVHKYIINHDSILGIYNTLAKEFSIPFLDYSLDSMCFDKGNFYNSQHLNAKGAQEFSLKLANDLKNMPF